MMTKMMKSTVRVIIVAMMMIAFTFAFAQATVNANEELGTVARVSEDRKEALAEKAASATTESTEVEPVVEGATGATEVKVQSVEEILAEIETKNQAPAVEEKAVAMTAVEEVIFAEGTTANEIVDDEVFEARVAETANAPATNTAVRTIDSATTDMAAESVTATFAETAAPKVSNVSADSLQIVGGKKVNFTRIGNSTFMNIDKLQAAIDNGNVCYPTDDMTKGVKYIAGHNPSPTGMTNVNTVKVGSVVRLSNATGYQDYRIVEQHDYKAGSYSFADVKFSKGIAGKDLWTMLQAQSENAVVIQFCVKIGGQTHYRFSYGQAI